MISLFDCLEQIKFIVDKTKMENTNNIVFPISFQIASFWTDDNNTKDRRLDIKVELYDPENEMIKDFIGKFIVKKGIVRFRSRININGLFTTKSGRYYFVIKYKNGSNKQYKKVAELPLDIDIKYKLSDYKKKKQ